MIRCDYCGNRIGPRDGYLSLQSNRVMLHLHSEYDSDCADQFIDQAKTIQGVRPPKPTA